ncbi:hypothetical protein EG329_001541 [Mollisiaceae sp. DMI_Dod_QoI]|nr:hypothetical protein EG329_001541 [Helotiales sp. DMI_Dod_QoI]
MALPLSRSDIEAAIAKYGPTLKLHPDEQYLNCSVEWMLSHSTLIDSKDKSKNIVHPRGNQLPQGPKQGTQYYLEVEDAAKPGNFSTAKAYVNAFWQKGLPYTDLQFWFFSAYNGHGTARFASLVSGKIKHEADINLAPLGEHWADWEYAAIRIDNTSKEMIGIMLSEHGKNIFFDKAAVVKQFKMVNGSHPVIYSSLNGHANFPAVGLNFSEHHQVLGEPAGLDFNIVNATADGGLELDCSVKYEVVAADWLNGTSEAYNIPAWVGYPYRWGPEGTTIHMKVKTLSDFIKAALGPKDKFEIIVLDDPITLLASELLHMFVKADINGAAAPATQAPWTGRY